MRRLSQKEPSVRASKAFPHRHRRTGGSPNHRRPTTVRNQATKRQVKEPPRLAACFSRAPPPTIFSRLARPMRPATGSLAIFFRSEPIVSPGRIRLSDSRSRRPWARGARRTSGQPLQPVAVSGGLPCMKIELVSGPRGEGEPCGDDRAGDPDRRLPAPSTIIAVENEFKVPIAEWLPPLVGRVDLIEVFEDRVEVIDVKSSRGKWHQEDVIQHASQLSLYAAGVEEIVKEIVKEIGKPEVRVRDCDENQEPERGEALPVRSGEAPGPSDPDGHPGPGGGGTGDLHPVAGVDMRGVSVPGSGSGVVGAILPSRIPRGAARLPFLCPKKDTRPDGRMSRAKSMRVHVRRRPVPAIFPPLPVIR